MNVHDKLYDLVAELEEQIENMPDGEDKDAAVKNLERLYKLLLEKETLDETVKDRRDKMNIDNETEKEKIKNDEKRRKHEFRTVIIGLAGVLGSQAVSIIASNCGFFVEKVPSAITKVLFRKA